MFLHITIIIHSSIDSIIAIVLLSIYTKILLPQNPNSHSRYINTGRIIQWDYCIKSYKLYMRTEFRLGKRLGNYGWLVYHFEVVLCYKIFWKFSPGSLMKLYIDFPLCAVAIIFCTRYSIYMYIMYIRHGSCSWSLII